MTSDLKEAIALNKTIQAIPDGLLISLQHLSESE